MENKDSERITNRKLGLKVGDYVIYTDNSNIAIFKKGWIYKITKIDEPDIAKDNWPYKLSNTNFWNRGKVLKKATKQEYIVAKLKGRLYE